MTMFMGVFETRTLAPPLDTQEGRVEGKCSCFSCENVKCMVQNPWVGEGRGAGTWVSFCQVGAAGLSEPLPHYSLFCGQF